ncbi:MAG: osmotically inducible protein C [Magnetovibrio sp.]|nr:osmotically inducible protein C [Magnetovibrio sp.]
METFMGKDLEEGPTLKTLRATSFRHRAYSSKIAIRDFSFLIDEPEKLGGENNAPTPMEYVIGALNGCFAVTIELLSEQYGGELQSLEILSEGTIDHRGLFGTAKVSPHFQWVKVGITISIKINRISRKQFEQLSTERCPVYNLIKDSGARTDVTWSWNVK